MPQPYNYAGLYAQAQAAQPKPLTAIGQTFAQQPQQMYQVERQQQQDARAEEQMAMQQQQAAQLYEQRAAQEARAAEIHGQKTMQNDLMNAQRMMSLGYDPQDIMGKYNASMLGQQAPMKTLRRTSGGYSGQTADGDVVSAVGDDVQIIPKDDIFTGWMKGFFGDDEKQQAPALQPEAVRQIQNLGVLAKSTNKGGMAARQKLVHMRNVMGESVNQVLGYDPIQVHIQGRPMVPKAIKPPVPQAPEVDTSNDVVRTVETVNAEGVPVTLGINRQGKTVQEWKKIPKQQKNVGGVNFDAPAVDPVTDALNKITGATMNDSGKVNIPIRIRR